MDWSELLIAMNIGDADIIATLITPLRKDGDSYKSGKVVGFKPGVYGGGHSRYKNGVPMSFDSTKMCWKKKPKVFVAYNCFTYGKSQHTDWVDVDNCTFEIVPNTPTSLEDVKKTM